MAIWETMICAPGCCLNAQKVLIFNFRGKLPSSVYAVVPTCLPWAAMVSVRFSEPLRCHWACPVCATHHPLGPGCDHRDWGRKGPGPRMCSVGVGPTFVGLIFRASSSSHCARAFWCPLFTSPAGTPGAWGALTVVNLCICCLSGAVCWGE